MNLLKEALRPLQKMLYLPPRGIDAGKGVKIMRPREIGASNRIHIGADTEIGRGCMITPIVEHEGEEFTPVIEIGKNVYIGPHLYMVAIGKLTIGDGCVLSEHVFLNDCSHGLNPLAGPIMRQRLVHGGGYYNRQKLLSWLSRFNYAGGNSGGTLCGGC